jgi:hypothetical protein
MLVNQEEIPPVLDKIAKIISEESFDKMTISAFREFVIKLRAGYEDTNDILRYFQHIGMIQVINGMIYKVNVTEKVMSLPGRPGKLTDEEKRWVKRNYQLGKKSLRMLAKELSEKRKDEPIGKDAIARALSN